MQSDTVATGRGNAALALANHQTRVITAGHKRGCGNANGVQDIVVVVAGIDQLGEVGEERTHREVVQRTRTRRHHCHLLIVGAVRQTHCTGAAWVDGTCRIPEVVGGGAARKRTCTGTPSPLSDRLWILAVDGGIL